MGKPPAEGTVLAFERYCDLLVTWNKVHNLTGHRAGSGIVRELFIDALFFLGVLPAGPISVADIGTGVGIPGIPIKLVRPEISLVLIESRRKCISFLGDLKRRLKLDDVRVIDGRAEEVPDRNPELKEGFDAVVSRSVGVKILPAARGLVKPGGCIILTGPPPGVATASKAGESLREVAFPRLGRTRLFLVWQGH